MRILNNNITNIATLYEHPAFVRNSMLSGHINDKWKSTTNTDTITLTVSSGEAVSFFGTNATSIAIYQGAVAAPNLLTTEFDTVRGMGWANYLTPEVGSHTINIVLSCGAGTFLEMGELAAGNITTFVDPKYGMAESFGSDHVAVKLPSGGWYTKKRNSPRAFTVQLDLERDSDFYGFMRDFYYQNGPSPITFRMNDTLTNLDWLIYGIIPEDPGGSHDNFSHSVVSFKIYENL